MTGDVMAQRSVEGISHQTVAHGVQAGQPRLTNTFAADRESSFMKAGYGKTVRPVCAADGGQLFNGRLLRPYSCEVAEQRRVAGGGGGGAKGRDQGERGSAKHAPDSDPGARDPGAEPRTASRKAKEEGAVHCASPPCQRRHALDSILRAQTQSCCWSRRGDLAGL